MAAGLTQTRVKNLTRRRRLTYLPPNGKVLSQNETAVVPGVLDTIIFLGRDITELDQYYDDIDNARIEVTKVGFGDTVAPVLDSFNAIFGNGTDTQFDFDVGFNTSCAVVLLYDLVADSFIDIFQLELLTPNSTSIRVTLSPAPAANSLQVFVFPCGESFNTTVGNGTDTQFDIDVGFITAGATVLLFNLLTNTPISIFQLGLSIPNATSIRLNMTPPPPPGSIQVFVFPP